MSDKIFIDGVDAVRAQTVDMPHARPLLSFVRDLTRYAADRRERDARRALGSPFSRVPDIDARALIVAAGENRPVAEAIEKERIPLGHTSAVAARRFAKALDTLARAFRAQGATASVHLVTLGLAFGFEALAGDERATFDVLVAEANAIDAAAAPGVAWDATELVAAIDRLAAHAVESAREMHEPRTPLARHERENARTVKRKRAHFSASSLGTFAACERRWYYRYVCAAVEDRGSSASFYGTAFHWALERFHEEYPRVDPADTELLGLKIDSYLATAFERFRSGFETTVEYELQRRRAKRTGRRYLSWLLERARTAPFAIIGTEASVELDLAGYTFIGYIDRLDRDDATGAVTVIDYKTGSIAESAEAYRESVASFVDFQLPFYYWARTAVGDRVTRLSLVPLKDAARDVRPIELEVVPVATPRGYGDAPIGTIGIDELERARTKMIEIAAHLADGHIERFPATDDPEACSYCAYKTACRERPLPREDRFGR
jgi:RecB family exonuclease